MKSTRRRSRCGSVTSSRTRPRRRCRGSASGEAAAARRWCAPPVREPLLGRRRRTRRRPRGAGDARRPDPRPVHHQGAAGRRSRRGRPRAGRSARGGDADRHGAALPNWWLSQSPRYHHRGRGGEPAKRRAGAGRGPGCRATARSYLRPSRRATVRRRRRRSARRQQGSDTRPRRPADGCRRRRAAGTPGRRRATKILGGTRHRVANRSRTTDFSTRACAREPAYEPAPPVHPATVLRSVRVTAFRLGAEPVSCRVKRTVRPPTPHPSGARPPAVPRGAGAAATSRS